MTEELKDAEREAFEALMRTRGEDYLYRRDVPGCDRHGDYCLQSVQDQWEVWQARAASTSANVAQGAEAVREQISRALHYPACWDTAAYPTLDSAACEAIACAKLGCSTCGEPK